MKYNAYYDGSLELTIDGKEYLVNVFAKGRGNWVESTRDEVGEGEFVVDYVDGEEWYDTKGSDFDDDWELITPTKDMEEQLKDYILYAV